MTHKYTSLSHEEAAAIADIEGLRRMFANMEAMNSDYHDALFLLLFKLQSEIGSNNATTEQDEVVVGLMKELRGAVVAFVDPHFVGDEPTEPEKQAALLAWMEHDETEGNLDP